MVKIKKRYIMKILKFFLGLLISLLLASCSESDEGENSMVEQGENLLLTIEASQEWYASNTRTIRQENGDVYWGPNDEVSLFFSSGGYVSGKNGGYKFTSQNTETAAIAEFTGVINGIIGGGGNLLEDGYFWAVYPYSKENLCEDGVIKTSLPNRQQAVEGTFADELFITVAHAQDVKLAFKNVCGGVKFCVSQSGIKSVVFRGNNDEKLAGKIHVAFDEEDKPKVTNVINGQTEVTLVAPNGREFEVGKFYYLVTLPTILQNGFTMTFNKSNGTYGSYIRTSSIEIKRSTFGKVENLDEDLTFVKDESASGGSENGFYLGIIGFNNDLYPYSIRHLTEESAVEYHSFIDGLSTRNGTLLYYAVDSAVDALQASVFPSNLYDVAVVTFTDGLDRGSLDRCEEDKNVVYLTNTDYLEALSSRLIGEKVSNQKINAYSIGVRGDDVTNYTSFQNNLKKLATSSDKVFEVSNMSEVNDKFMEIADLLGETKYVQKFMLEIAGPSHGVVCRFTFDNITSATSSRVYIQGTFNRVNKSLENLVFTGMTSTSGSAVTGIKNDSGFYEYTFEGIQSLDGELISVDNVQHWYKEDDVWQKDSEFVFDPGDVGIEKIKRSAAILLNLDCSSSLGDDFATLQTCAKSFIDKLVENAVDPNEVASISLNKSSVTLPAGSNLTLKASILPTTALEKRVEWFSTNTTVATVNENGVVTAIEHGNATIIAKTLDGGLIATCKVSVVNLVKEISFACSELELYNGETNTLQVSIEPENASNKALSWSSANTSVATVDDSGTITPVKAGTTTISAIAKDGSGIKATCQVTILQHVESIVLDHKTVKLHLGTTKQLTATIAPNDASDKGVVWTSSDESVVSVSQSGLLTSVGKGSAQITATAKDGGNVAVCNVEVVQPVTSINLDRATASLYVNSSVQLEASVGPNDANDKSVMWSSSNSSVASVDQSGFVKALSAGTVTITATAQDGSGVTAKCVVTVIQHVSNITLNLTTANLYTNESLQISATISPTTASNQALTWGSSNSAVASVTQSGLVTGLSAGTAKITATAQDGSGVVAECSINVLSLSQTPIDLALAVQKGGVRYFIPLETYRNMDLSGYTKEGVTVVSDSESFVLGLNISSGLTYSDANDFGTLPTKNQVNAIVDNWAQIDEAISVYGGTPMGSNSYWSGHTYVYSNVNVNNPTPVTRPPVVITYHYYYNSSGLTAVTDTGLYYCVRYIIATL